LNREGENIGESSRSIPIYLPAGLSGRESQRYRLLRLVLGKCTARSAGEAASHRRLFVNPGRANDPSRRLLTLFSTHPEGADERQSENESRERGEDGGVPRLRKAGRGR
jgi:hypothetical protein